LFPQPNSFLAICSQLSSQNLTLDLTADVELDPILILVTLRLAVYRQSVRLSNKSLKTHDQQFFQMNTCCHSPYVTSSLTRGCVCRLQLLLALLRAVILRLLSQIRDSPNLEGQVPVFTSPRNRVDRLHPQALSSLFGALLYRQGADPTENTAYSFVAYRFVAAGMCLLSICLAMDVNY
jgi:hypothetical protein